MDEADRTVSRERTIVDDVVTLARRRPARLGDGRLLCIDGPSGAGKSTLARTVVASLRETGSTARLICVDDLLNGWTGSLAGAVGALVRDVLTPLATGRPGAYQRYDWVAGAQAEWVPVPATDLLVVEGVGAGSRPAAAYSSALVWMEAPPELRRRRGVARDGDAFAPHWESWAAQESAHHAGERTRERADLVVVTG